MKWIVWPGLVWALFLCHPLPAAETDAKVVKGPVTNLPLPRYVSIKAGKANVRRGPGRAHRVDWVFQRRGLPVEVVAEYGHWRRVRDADGAGGWVHYALLSGARHVLVVEETLLRAGPEAAARAVARAEAGAVLRLGPCDAIWCRLQSGRHRGWAEKSVLWGVKPGEVRQ